MDKKMLQACGYCLYHDHELCSDLNCELFSQCNATQYQSTFSIRLNNRRKYARIIIRDIGCKKVIEYISIIFTLSNAAILMKQWWSAGNLFIVEKLNLTSMFQYWSEDSSFFSRDVNNNFLFKLRLKTSILFGDIQLY